MVLPHNTPLPHVGATLTLPHGINSLAGAGGTDTLLESQFTRWRTTTSLLTLSVESYRKDGSHRTTILSIRQRHPLAQPTLLLAQPQSPRPLFWSWLADCAESQVYTDGSFKLIGTTTQRLLGTTTAHGQTGIACKQHSGHFRHLAITNELIQHKSSHTTELLGQIVVLRCARGLVHTDSQSAIDTIRHNLGKTHPLLSLLPDTTCHSRLVKVKSHPESYKPKKQWNGNDWGIFNADAIAGGDIDAITTTGPPDITIVSDLDIVTELSKNVTTIHL